MPTGSFRKSFLLLFYIFLILNSVFIFLNVFFPATTLDYHVLLAGNFLLFIVGSLSLRMSCLALEHKSVQGFLRLVYASFLLKFFILAIAAFMYIYIYKKNVNKPALFGCFAMYFIYTFIELRAVLKQPKKPNA
jgi:hypothetical protein